MLGFKGRRRLGFGIESSRERSLVLVCFIVLGKGYFLEFIEVFVII